MLCIAAAGGARSSFQFDLLAAPRSLNQMIDIMRQEFPGVDVKYQPRDALIARARHFIG